MNFLTKPFHVLLDRIERMIERLLKPVVDWLGDLLSKAAAYFRIGVAWVIIIAGGMCALHLTSKESAIFVGIITAFIGGVIMQPALTYLFSRSSSEPLEKALRDLEHIQQDHVAALVELERLRQMRNTIDRVDPIVNLSSVELHGSFTSFDRSCYDANDPEGTQAKHGLEQPGDWEYMAIVNADYIVRLGVDLHKATVREEGDELVVSVFKDPTKAFQRSEKTSVLREIREKKPVYGKLGWVGGGQECVVASPDHPRLTTVHERHLAEIDDNLYNRMSFHFLSDEVARRTISHLEWIFRPFGKTVRLAHVGSADIHNGTPLPQYLDDLRGKLQSQMDAAQHSVTELRNKGRRLLGVRDDGSQ